MDNEKPKLTDSDPDEIPNPDDLVKCSICGEIYDRSILAYALIHQHDPNIQIEDWMYDMKGKRVESEVNDHLKPFNQQAFAEDLEQLGKRIKDQGNNDHLKDEN